MAGNLTQKLINKIRKKKNFKDFQDYESFLHKTQKYIQNHPQKLNPYEIGSSNFSKTKKFRLILNGFLKKYYAFQPQNTQAQKQIANQHKLLQKFIKNCQNTEFGQKYNLANIKNFEDFQKQVPIHHYDDLKPRIDKALQGQENIIYPGKIPRFATSSGTTNKDCKYLPITYENLKYSHYKGSQTLMSFYYKNNPDSKIFLGKMMIIGGSFCDNPYTDEKNVGFITAILQKNAPKVAQYFKEPKSDIAYIPDRESKIKQTIKSTLNSNITGISGSPVRCNNFLNKVLDKTKQKDILDIRPNFELFIRGGMSINLYQEHLQKIFQNKQINFYQAYNASEGFFGAQINNTDDDMLLLTNHGTVYEFIKLEDYLKQDYKTITLDQVETDQEFVLVITTNSGLWRYIIGDTIKFTSLDPFKIKVSGRTKYMIDVAGERVTQETAEQMLKKTLQHFGENLKEYTVGPYKINEKYGHERIIENEKLVGKEKEFSQKLDEIFCKEDEYYHEERIITESLQKPKINFVPESTFYQRLKSKNKLGGQYKIPKLANHRKYLDEILKLTQS